ncbi:MAG: preprotein translocase subunit SecG [Myxococcaceae bacterium]|nr:preprotein translocase subunit SecG [Myxococcaceae bacterium]
MIYFVSGLHVLLCVFMIFVILLQPGKDAGMGAALGGGAATSAFGGRGAVTFLGKVTAVCAIGYFITSLGLSFVGLKSSVASSIAEEAAKEAPATPPAPVPADGAKPAEGAAAPAPADAPTAVEKASENPGQPVPAVPEKKVTGTEAGP